MRGPELSRTDFYLDGDDDVEAATFESVADADRRRSARRGSEVARDDDKAAAFRNAAEAVRYLAGLPTTATAQQVKVHAQATTYM